MSLARAFTRRREKRNVDAAPAPPARSSARDSVKMVSRNKISSPVALLSTTNMLSYNAPDIAMYRQQKQAEATQATEEVKKVSSSSSSTHSNSTREDSDNSSVSSLTKDSFLTDNSSVDENSSAELSPSLEENHLSRYFPPAKSVRRSVSTSDMALRLSSTLETPAIPQRAPSHSKRAHEASLARKRSMQTVSSDRDSVNSSILNSTTLAHTRSTSAMSTRSSVNLRSTASRSNTPISQVSSTSSFDHIRSNLTSSSIEPNHPFGKELEQLNEVAEEFVDTVRDAEWDADASCMKQRGLARWCANDYMREIEPLFGNAGFWRPVVSGDGGFF